MRWSRLITIKAYVRAVLPRDLVQVETSLVLVRRLPALAQEAEELHALAQAPLHHVRASDHLAHDRGDFRSAEIEALVEVVHRPEDLGVAEVRIIERGDLRAALGQKLHLLVDQPAVLHRLPVEERARIGRGERNLDGVRVDFGGEPDRLLDRLLGLAGQAENEGAVDDDAELVTVLGEAPGHVDAHALLDVVQDLLIAGLVTDQQQAQPIVLEHLQGGARHVGLCVAGPDDAELADLARERLDARQVVGQRVVVEEEFLDLREGGARPGQLLDHMPDAAHAVAVAADGLRPQAEGAARFAAAAGIERDVRMPQVAAEIILNDEVALVDRRDEWQVIHVLENGTFLVVHDGAIRPAPGQPGDPAELASLSHLLDGEIELVARDEIDGGGSHKARLGLDGDLRTDHPDLEFGLERLERL